MADLLNLHLFHPKQWREAESSYLHFDRELSDVAKSYCPDGSTCLPIVRFLTESPYITILFGVVVAFFLWRASHHLGKKKQLLLLCLVSASVGLSDLIGNQLKYIFSRMRPDHELYFLESGIRPAFSFPSNHAFNLFALAGILWLLHQKKFIQGVKFPILIGIIALLVALSRVFVGRHFPLDVLAGLVLAIFYALLMSTIIAKMLKTPRR